MRRECEGKGKGVGEKGYPEPSARISQWKAYLHFPYKPEGEEKVTPSPPMPPQLKGISGLHVALVRFGFWRAFD